MTLVNSNINSQRLTTFHSLYQTSIVAPVIAKKLSLWSQNKVKLMIITAFSIAAIALTGFYIQIPKPGCVERFYDDWTNSYCKNGELILEKTNCMPSRIRFKGLIEQCASGIQIPGCFHGNYYRELTEECKYNPAAALCNGNYDYQKDFLDPISMPGSLENWKKKQTYHA